MDLSFSWCSGCQWIAKYEMLEYGLQNWRIGRRSILLDAPEHAAELLCDCPSPSLVPHLRKQGWAVWSCLLGPFCLSKTLQPKHTCFNTGEDMWQSLRVVVVSPWYWLGYVNNARNAKEFKEVLDYSVGSSPSVLFLKACAIFIYTL